MYESIFSLECFSFVKASRISERNHRKKLNPSLSEWPIKFSDLFVLLKINSVHLNLKAMSHKSDRKRKPHTHKNECFNMKYLKLMAVRFKKAFYLSKKYSSLY